MGRNIRTFILIILDAILIAASVYTAYGLRFDFRIRDEFLVTLPYVIGSFTVITIGCFFYFRIYKRVWRYASVGDLLSIIRSVVFSTTIFFLTHNLIVNYFFGVVVPRSIYILSPMIIILTVGGSRLLWRMVRDNYIKLQPHHRKGLVVGAGAAGSLVVKELKHSKSEYYPVAFIDDDPRKKGLEIMGVPVMGDRHALPEIVKKFNIEDIIIAMPSAKKDDIAEVIAIAKTTGAVIKIIPNVGDLINGKVTVSMRNVSVDDLLGREPVTMDLDEIKGYITNKVVLVTGAGGSIGSELCRQISPFEPSKLLILGHGENSIYEIELELKSKYVEILPIIADVQDIARIRAIFQKYKPDIVFHAAAHKHVPLMEANPTEAVKNNILGTKNVAICSHEFGVERFVMISTDKAVNPSNVMGATKRAAEMIIQSLDKESKTKFSAVRFGNVLGSRGSVIPLFKRQIEAGGPVTVTHPDMVRYFMTIPEAVSLVIQTGAIAKGGEVFILDMGKPVRIADLAEDLIRSFGLEPNKDIRIEYTGIRPGEKLFEELFTLEEGTLATKHNRIYVGKASDVSFHEVTQRISIFENMISSKEQPHPDEVKRLLKDIVPNYNLTGQSGKAVREALRASMEIVATLDEARPKIH